MRDDHERRTMTARSWLRGAARWRLLAAAVVTIAVAGSAAWTGVTPGAIAQDTTISPPSAPALAAPADGTTVLDAWRDVELQWDPVPGATEYQVVLNEGERTGPWVTGTSWSPGSLPAGSYEWSVRARNDSGIGAPGQGYSFTVAGDDAVDTSSELATFDPLPFPLQQEAFPLDLIVANDGGTVDVSDSQITVPASTGAAAIAEMAPEVVGTPVAAGTPVPVAEDATVAAAPESAPGADGVVASGSDGGNGETGETGEAGGDGGASGETRRGNDGANGADGAPGQDGQPGEDVVVVDSSSSGGGGKDGNAGSRADRDRKAREPKERNRTDSNGNGGVSEVIAEPLAYMHPAALQQEDAADSTAGATGEDGTVNGEPRETTTAEPGVITGPGAPLAPAGVLLPPGVPGLAEAVAGTTEVAVNAVADTTVFTAAPDSPQTIESEPLLALGGPQGATSLISFDVTGVGEGTVLSALLTFTGAGESGAPGGGVGVIYEYMVPEDITANGVPGGDTALNVHGAPSWFEAVEPGGITAVDVTGSVYGDGAITFILPGQAETSGAIYSTESGVLPQLVLTVALPG